MFSDSILIVLAFYRKLSFTVDFPDRTETPKIGMGKIQKRQERERRLLLISL